MSAGGCWTPTGADRLTVGQAGMGKGDFREYQDRHLAEEVVGRGKRGWMLVGAVPAEIQCLHPWSDPLPDIYTSKIAGIDLMKPIGGQAIYQMVILNNFYLPLSGCTSSLDETLLYRMMGDWIKALHTLICHCDAEIHLSKFTKSQLFILH